MKEFLSNPDFAEFWRDLAAAGPALRVLLIIVLAWVAIAVMQRAIRLLRTRIAGRMDDREAVKRAETLGRVFRYLVAEDTDAAADEDAAPTLPAGAKAPLKSGKAPKGYDIKGNADSGLFHEPDGRWYDATVAEFWFKSAEDAEAAGFTRAGGANKDEEADK